MSRKFLGVIAIVCLLPLFATARQQTPRTGAAACTQYTKPTIPSNAGAGETVKLDDLIDHKDRYMGKVVTVTGEMHRIFNDHTFTIEDDDLFKDDDVLIISDVPRAQAVTALEKSIEPGKNVRVTGFVYEYDKQKLECLYGPLQTESRDGHSFTKAPVLIVQKVQPAATAVTAPGQAEPNQLALAQPEQPAPAAPAETPTALPKTASSLPFVGLFGLVFVLAAWGIRSFHS
jgi:hypothetical protein